MRHVAYTLLTLRLCSMSLMWADVSCIGVYRSIVPFTRRSLHGHFQLCLWPLAGWSWWLIDDSSSRWLQDTSSCSFSGLHNWGWGPVVWIYCAEIFSLKCPGPSINRLTFETSLDLFVAKYLLGTSYIASGTRPRQMVWPQAPTGPDPQDLGVDSKTDRTWQEANRQQERNRILARAAFHRHACRLPERHNQPLKAFGWVWESEAWQVHCKC